MRQNHGLAVSVIGVAGALAYALLLVPGRAAPVGQKVDKPKLEQFIRYVEGYTSIVKISIDDPVPSPFKGFSRLQVHLSMGAQKLDKTYYLNGDGEIVNGSLWSLAESPFLDTLQHLPRNGPGFGPANAKVVMVVFSDFQCPYCREFAKTIRDQIPKKYPNEVRIEFQDFPIDSIHKWARLGAEASHCVGDGKPNVFWAFHDWVFEHQEELNPANLKSKTVEFAGTQNLDQGKVSACIDSHATSSEVLEGIQAGQELGVQQTPTSFINGRLVSGALSASALDGIIQLELHRPPDVPGPVVGKSPEAKLLKP